MGLGYLFCCIKSSSSEEPANKAAPRWRVFSLKELHSATNNFNYDNKLGEGAFGSVYWGQLWDGSQEYFRQQIEIVKGKMAILKLSSLIDNTAISSIKQEDLLAIGSYARKGLIKIFKNLAIECRVLSFSINPSNIKLLEVAKSRSKDINIVKIAVKRLKTWSSKAEMEFAVEIQVLARVRHENLLSLRGYCAEGKERLIVYDYMPNLSLLSHLHGHHAVGGHLDWGRRMNIAIGSAEGIAYLHHHATPHIIHRDIKTSNILLDSEFQPRVADFGFAKLIPDGASHVTTRVKGTLGYLAPEYAMLGKAKESCDVYSFGVLLLELLSGRKPIDQSSLTSNQTIIEWAFPLAQQQRFEEIADPKLSGKFVKGELRRMVLVALICAQNKPEKRPIMLDVVDLLKGASKENLLNLEDNELFKEDSIPSHRRFTISEDSGNAMDSHMG